MKIAASAAIGSVVGAVSGFVGYFIVFIFTDVLQNAALRLDIEESHIFLFVLFACAAWGGIMGDFFALIQAGRRQAKRSIDTPLVMTENTEDDVWPPAPRPQ